MVNSKLLYSMKLIHIMFLATILISILLQLIGFIMETHHSYNSKLKKTVQDFHIHTLIHDVIFIRKAYAL